MRMAVLSGGAQPASGDPNPSTLPMASDADGSLVGWGRVHARMYAQREPPRPPNPRTALQILAQLTVARLHLHYWRRRRRSHWRCTAGHHGGRWVHGGKVAVRRAT
jgi:hypothetical protein